MVECNAKFLADIFNCTVQNITKLIPQGHVIRISVNKYDYFQSCKLYIRYLKSLEKSDRRESEKLNLRLKEIELQDREKEIVLTAEVERQAAECALKVVEGMLTIPDRVSAIVASEKSENKVRKLLTAEIKNALLDVNPYVKAKDAKKK